MVRFWFIIGIIIGSSCFAIQPAVAQKTIADKNILLSFAKIIRTKQYICQPCRQVEPLAHTTTGLSYEVTCNNNLTYTVTLTPHSDMIVKPVLAHKTEL